ncbi:MAG: nucleoside triphosphate pyrophosphohydrolase [Nitrospirota bacterium]|nr:nucleoside triphosphate pyrophosphohydrolase [Nitrospirota bacterium]
MPFDPVRYLETILAAPDSRATPRTDDPSDCPALQRLVMIIDHLRGEYGCPFDKKQTLSALVCDLKDEIFELEESILKNDSASASREIGDLFLILLMARRILWEENHVTMGRILGDAALKMVSRHPHVFEEHLPDKSLEAIWETWEEKKRKEPEHKDRTSVLDGIPVTMPALSIASKQGQKAGRVGFDWKSADEVASKVEEEWGEVLEARSQGKERLTEEIGDLLFVLAQFSRHMEIRPEEALSQATRKFRNRFVFMENEASLKGTPLSELTPESWNLLWERAKLQEKVGP